MALFTKEVLITVTDLQASLIPPLREMTPKSYTSLYTLEPNIKLTDTQFSKDSPIENYFSIVVTVTELGLPVGNNYGVLRYTTPTKGPVGHHSTDGLHD